ncbi:MAG: beta-propeller domain-containing protein [Planctomycetota bacterium]
MKRLIISTALFALIVWLPTGCENVVPDSGTDPGNGVTAGGSLKSFASREEFESYFRSELTTRNSSLSEQNMLQNRDDEAVSAPGTGADSIDGGGNAGPQASPPLAESTNSLTSDSDGSSPGFSTTTVQEVGVDEADVVKTDGNYLYLIDDNASANSKLRIVRANPASLLAVMSELDLEGYGREIYLQDGKLIAITATFGGLIYDGPVALGEPGIAVAEPSASGGGSSSSGIAVAPLVSDGTVEAIDADNAVSDEPPPTDAADAIDIIAPPTDLLPPSYRYERPNVTVTVVEVADPANPRVVSKTTFDGSATSSRMIDGKLHMILANYQNYYFDVMPRLGMVDFAADSVDVDQVLPTYERTGVDGTTSSGDLLTWSEIYRPIEPDGFGVVSILSLDSANSASDKSGLSAVGIIAEPGLIYSSIDALYLTNTNYDWQNQQRETTDVHKFLYVGGRAIPVATGQVPGRILNQYSMGEHNGFLRVATGLQEIGTDGRTIEHNNVYCLQEVSGELRIVGRIENFALGETIQSARFVGTRGYVVTFEQIDPLFTLDLSDPTNPRIVGELKVPGFSTFIRPIDENHLLTVGQYIPEEDGINFRPSGVQLSIFDVTDFANPVQTHQVVLTGDSGAWSEALYDPKAFTYFEDEGLLALPVYINAVYDYSNVYPPPEIFEPLPVAEGEVRPDPLTTTSEVAAEGGDAIDPGVITGGETIELGEPSLISVGGDELIDVIDGIGMAPIGVIDYVEPTLISPGFEGLVVYRVSPTGGFSELGRIATNFEREGFNSWNSYTRGVFIAENVFAVTNQGVRGAPVNDLASVPYELFYGQMYPIEIYDDLITYVDGGGSMGTGTDGIAIPVSDEDAGVEVDAESGELLPAESVVGSPPVKK